MFNQRKSMCKYLTILLSVFLVSCLAPPKTPVSEPPISAQEVNVIKKPGPQIQWQERSALTFSKAESEDKLLFTYIYIDGCNVCNTFEETVLKHKDIVRFVNEQMVPVKVSADYVVDLMFKLQIQSLPAILFISPRTDGYNDLLFFVEGAPSVQQLLGILKAMKDAYEPVDDALELKNHEIEPTNLVTTRL
jgi:thioredoxin-related protein